MSSATLTGYEYYVTFIDDFSRKTWIYFLRSKRLEEVLLWFQELKALVENQTGKKIKVLWSDNGGEYAFCAFDEYCWQEGIKRQLTVPYTPQQNGLAKRKNHVIVVPTRAMLHDQRLPFFLWAKAFSTVVYVQNKSPNRALRVKLPRRCILGRSLK